MARKILYPAGALVLLIIIFGVPAVLVPNVMDDVPDRSRTKVFTNYQEAANIIERTFAKHNAADKDQRLTPLPKDTKGWIELVNPMGRKAPGGGLALLPEANNETGAVGVEGDESQVTLTIPAYRGLESQQVTLRAKP